MSYNHRCRKKATCGRRKTLPKMIDEYVRRPKCPGCGEDTLVFDPSVKAQTKRRGICRCDALGDNAPHRPGGSVFCIHSKKEPTEEDWEKRYDHYNDKN